MVSFTFTDNNIRGGQSTTGYLDITAGVTENGETRMLTVNRLIFDNEKGGPVAGLNVNNTAFTEYVASAVPEPSSLGLLALGAGGLLARRRVKRSA
jgi:hypothetical protein